MESNTISSQFIGKTQEEIKQLKVDSLSAVDIVSFEKDNYSITIDKIGTEDDMLMVMVTAEKNGKKFFVDNPLYFRNPPIFVEDGTFNTSTDEDGNEVKTPNYKEDLQEALKKIIIDTLEVAV